MTQTQPQAVPQAHMPREAAERSARWRLSRYSVRDFVGDSLFDAIGRVVSEANCLPRKELFESWEVANRVRRRVRGRPILELAAGHGLVTWLLLLLDPTAPGARCVDRRKPRSAERPEAALTARWPRLTGKVRWEEGDLRRVTASPDELVVSVHACGVLTDRVLDAALAARAAVAVLPCCHNLRVGNTAGLEAWMDDPLAVDVMRALRLRAASYRVYLLKIPEEITPQNRLLIGTPVGAAGVARSEAALSRRTGRRAEHRARRPVRAGVGRGGQLDRGLSLAPAPKCRRGNALRLDTRQWLDTVNAGCAGGADAGGAPAL